MDILQIAGSSDTGRRRQDNQDTLIFQQIWDRNETALLAVIDGVGGMAGGDKAAAIARDSITDYMRSPKGDALTMLREAVVFANNQIFEARKDDPRYSGMCCVLTAAVADALSQRLYFAHVGDSRLYRFRDGVLTKLTKDHSLVGMREDAGDISEEDAMRHPRRNEILREVGSVQRRLDDEDFMDFEETEFLPGDCILLCSDGLSDMINSVRIEMALLREQPLMHKVDELIDAANEAGGNDNVTVVLALNAAQSRPAQERRVRTDAMPELPQQPPPYEPAPSQAPSRRKLLLPGILVLVLLAGGLAWYLWPEPPAQPVPANRPDTAVGAAASPGASGSARSLSDRPGYIDSVGRALSPLPLAERHLIFDASMDTIRILAPLSLDELQSIAGSAGKHPVICPAADSLGAGPAIRLGKALAGAGPRTISAITISGFGTGIEVPQGARIRLDKVRFESVARPVVLLFPDGREISQQIQVQ